MGLSTTELLRQLADELEWIEENHHRVKPYPMTEALALGRMEATDHITVAQDLMEQILTNPKRDGDDLPSYHQILEIIVSRFEIPGSPTLWDCIDWIAERIPIRNLRPYVFSGGARPMPCVMCGGYGTLIDLSFQLGDPGRCRPCPNCDGCG